SLLSYLRSLTPPSPLFPYTTLFRSLFPRHLQDLADPIREVVPVHLPPTSSSRRLSLQHATHIRRAHRGQLRVTGLASLECRQVRDRKSTRLNSSHGSISYAVFCLKN